MKDRHCNFTLSFPFSAEEGGAYMEVAAGNVGDFILEGQVLLVTKRPKKADQLDERWLRLDYDSLRVSWGKGGRVVMSADNPCRRCMMWTTWSW